jgi:hypothetical protein
LFRSRYERGIDLTAILFMVMLLSALLFGLSLLVFVSPVISDILHVLLALLCVVCSHSVRSVFLFGVFDFSLSAFCKAFLSCRMSPMYNTGLVHNDILCTIDTARGKEGVGLVQLKSGNHHYHVTV